MNHSLFSALKLEKISAFVVLSLAIAVASFCIICTLLLMVTEKSKEIAIMKAIGASDGTILRIFMTEGLLIGGTGTVFGVLTGFVACYGLQWFGVRLDPAVYYVERLPIEVNLLDYFLVGVCALLITILATVYPAIAASRLRPVEGIRYE
jgi:lipoprotein-releasing system permease protein